MADDFESLDVKRVSQLLHNNEDVDGNRYKKGHQHQGRRGDRPKRETKDYLHTMEKAAQRSNDILGKQGSAFRFRVYDRGAEIYIEVVRMDNAGTVVQTITKKITHQDFDTWIEDLAQIEGLMFDTIA